MKLEIHQSAFGDYFWMVRNKAGKIAAESAMFYTRASDARRGYFRFKRSAP